VTWLVLRFAELFTATVPEVYQGMTMRRHNDAHAYLTPVAIAFENRLLAILDGTNPLRQPYCHAGSAWGRPRTARMTGQAG